MPSPAARLCDEPPGEVAEPEGAGPEPAGLLADWELLLRTHLARLAGRLEGHLGRQEELLQQLAEGTRAPAGASAPPPLPPAPRGDVLAGTDGPGRRLLAEGVHAAPPIDGAPTQAFGERASESSIGSSAYQDFERPTACGFRHIQEEKEPSDDGLAKPSSRASSKGMSEISKLSELLEAHMAKNQSLLSKPHRGLLMDGLRSPEPAKQVTLPPTSSVVRPSSDSTEEPEVPPVPGAEKRQNSKSSRKSATLGHAMSFTSNEELLREQTREDGQDLPSFHLRRSTSESVGGCCLNLKAKTKSFVRSSYFENMCCFLIITNTVFFGIEVQVMADSETGEAPAVFQAITYLYTAVFTWELGVRLLADRSQFCLGHNVGWNFLDVLIVGISLAELMLDIVSCDGSNLAYVRVIRMARVIRVLRVLRVMRFVRSLRILVHSVLNTLRSLFWTMLLLAIIFYVFAILFTQAATQYRVHGGMEGPPVTEITLALRSYFGSVPASVYTLFKSITNGLSWQDVVEPLSSVHWVWVVIFVSYIAFAYLAVLNVVTGVFCQTAIESANHDQDMVVQEQMLSKKEYCNSLQRLFRDIDTQNRGVITLKQFEDRLKEPNLQAYFGAMEITIDEAWNLFKLLDTDESHVIDIEEFVSGCLRLRGNARTMDIAMLLYQSKWTMQRLTAMTRSIDGQFEVLAEQLLGRIREQQEPADRAVPAAGGAAKPSRALGASDQEFEVSGL